MNLEKVNPLVWTLLWLIIGFQSIGAFVEGGREAALPGGDDQKDDQKVTPVMSQQLPSSSHLLIVQALNDMENRMEDKLSQLRNFVNDKMCLLDSETKSQLSQFQNGLNSQLFELQNILDGKIDTLDTKTENRLARNFNNLHDKFDGLKNRMEDRFKSTDEKLIHLKVHLNTIKGIESSVKACETTDDILLKNCYRGMAKDVPKRNQRLELMRDNTLDRDILCDTQTDGGGWIVIQRRTEGDVDFYRNWAAYKNGFGTPPGDFWLGNEAIYKLTNKDAYELRIDIINGTEDLFFVFSRFKLESEDYNYSLRLMPIYKDVEDLRNQSALSLNNGYQFTTYDRDNDERPGYNCAEKCHGGWWYTTYQQCAMSNLNGRWNDTSFSGVWYSAWTKRYYPCSTEIKMRIL